MNPLELFIKISVDTGSVEKDIDEVSDTIDEMGDKSDTAGGKFDAMGALSQAAGKVIADAFETAVSAVSNFVQTTVDDAITYESSLAKVQTIMDTTAVSTDDMSSAIKDVSSQYGISASDIADSVYGIISATGDTAGAIDIVTQSTMLAKAGFADSADATSVLTTAMNAYKLESEDLSGVSDSLIATQNLGVTTVAELSANMGKAIATGSAYGVSLENIETGYVALTKNGIGTAEATTYLNSMMAELGDSGTTVGGILQEKTGKSFGELMESGSSLSDVLKILYDSVDGDTEALMNLWSSQEAGKASSAIASQGFEQMDSWLQEIQTASSDVADETADAYAIIEATPEEKIAQFKETLTNTATEAVQPLIDTAMTYLPQLQTILETVITGVTTGISFIADHLTLFEVLATTIGTIVTVLGVYNAIQTASNAIQATYTALKQAGVIVETEETVTLWGMAAAELAAYAPLLLIIAAIAAAIAVGVLIVKNWDTIKETCITVFETVKETVSDAFETIQNVIQTAIMFIAEIFSAAAQILLLPWTFIWENFGDELTTAWDTITGVIQTALDTISGIISTVMSAILTVVTPILEAISSAFSTVWGGIQTTVSTIVSAIQTAIVTPISTAYGTVTTVLGNIKKAFVTKLGDARDAVKGIIDKIKGFFNFSWSLPHLKMPHFTITGKFAINPPSVPHFSVSWYAKAMDEAYVLDGATPFGMMGSDMLVGGETGREVVSGESHLVGLFNDSVSNALGNRLDGIVQLLDKYLPNAGNIYLDGQTLVGATAGAMDVELGKIYARGARG